MNDEKLFFTGALPSPKDNRDYKFGDIAGAVSPVIPYHSDIEDIILNQGASSQCGACALVAARYETEFLQNGNTQNLSHTYVYGSDLDYDGEGMYLRTVMKIGKAGIPYKTNWESWGTKLQCRKLKQTYTNSQTEEEAYMLRGSSYYSCYTWAEVCNACRATNGSVIVMMPIYSNWYSVGADGEIGKNTNVYLGNHFMRVKDYEILSNGVLKIRCQNSWGKDWGDKGYCYLYSDKHMFLEASCLVDDIDEVVRKLTFTDVAEDRWSAEAINWNSEHGLMTGYEDGTFRPAEPMTREQQASVLYRFWQQFIKK